MDSLPRRVDASDTNRLAEARYEDVARVDSEPTAPTTITSGIQHPRPKVRDFQAALVGDLEPADLLDLLGPQLDTQGVALGGREHVEDAAADGELVAPLHHVGADIGGVDERLLHLLEVDAVADGAG